MLGDLPFVGSHNCLGVCLTPAQGLATFLSPQGGVMIYQACLCYLPLVVCQGNPALKEVLWAVWLGRAAMLPETFDSYRQTTRPFATIPLI